MSAGDETVHYMQRLSEVGAERDRYREKLDAIHAIAGRFIARGHSGFEYEEISEALAVALQELSVIRRRSDIAQNQADGPPTHGRPKP